MTDQPTDILKLSANIVAAYLANNTAAPEAIPAIISTVHATLASLASGQPVATQAPAAAAVPAVPVKKSVTDDYIVCLEDGKKLRMLKRHLRVSFGLTPAAYRAKWGLPPEYPMTAPSYAAVRSRLAREINLGQHRSRAAASARALRAA
jgi:predicted transcriptional regulator